MTVTFIDIPSHLVDSAKDYYYLLERGYRRNYALKFVSDHYKLGKLDRLILYRSIHPSRYIREVNSKLVNNLSSVNSIYIDYYNVVITIMEIIEGNPIYMGNDGFVRDMAGLHGRVRDINKLLDATELLFMELDKYDIEKVHLFLEVQISRSGEVSKYIRNRYRADVTLTKNVDRALLDLDKVIASSDSIINFKVSKIIDLPYLIAINMDKKIRIYDFRRIFG